MPRIRFTVRRLMLAVAVVAIIIAAVFWTQRLMVLRKVYLGKAAAYAYYEGIAKQETHKRLGRDGSGYPFYPEYFTAMRAKYEHAAQCPWLPIAPDPPAPEE
jgi:hypothetical protein